MNLVGNFIQYLNAYEKKNLDSISDMFSDDIALRDWKISVQGKSLAIDETRKNFANADSIEIHVLSTMANDNMVSGELKIVVDKAETLFVVDVVTFDEDGKITSIHAYLGRED
ncbi:nuclear transport factor 2 family protein [Alteromonas sp. BL110]|uniref:nuclear transport factor 2 family protein n=1 Tax=Alteromonas sp. BL110 TaxID=1714845 RepID=UPI000E495E55|nr:nuclear transport factor 2 family protein [Alteromonas sp. BL110]AXT40043.1 nuclear transport factor 2 family protein [Alteromonas sp. BL110]RKM79272.1 nuclear transport factor 2 family protein [Alteromonas sp. BL110]